MRKVDDGEKKTKTKKKKKQENNVVYIGQLTGTRTAHAIKKESPAFKITSSVIAKVLFLLITPFLYANLIENTSYIC